MLASLADRARWVYAGGLAVVVGVRVVPGASAVPDLGRTAAVALALSAMVFAYAAERYRAGTTGIERPVLVGVGGVGVGVGGAVALAGEFAGLLFLAGGLAFLARGLGGGEA